MIRPGSSPGEVVKMVPFQTIHVGANYHLARDKIPRAKGSLAVHPKLDFGSEWARKPWRLAVKPWSDHGPTFFVFYHYVPIPWEEDQGHGSSSRVAGGAEGAEGDTARRPTAHGPADGGYPRDGLRGTDDRVADDAIDATDNGDRDRVGRGSGSQGTGGASSSSPDFSGRPGLGSRDGADRSSTRGNGMTLQAEARRVQVGQTVTVPVWLRQAADVANMNVVVRFDTGVVVPEADLLPGNLLSNSLFTGNANETGIIRLGFAATRGISGTGTIAYLPFRAVGQPGSRAPLRLTVTTANDPQGAQLAIDCVDGEVLIVGPDGLVPGDVDGDGRLTELDALAALQMSVRLIPEQLTLDVDGDQQVTSRDATIILQHAVNGIDVR